MQGAFHHKPNIDDLPIEIIPEIASYLDLEDVFSLQQTNRKLRNSINVPIVWLTLAKTYSARHFHVYQPQFGRFDDLTEDELHKWIRKRLHFDRIWNSQTLQPRFRTVSEPSIGYPTLKLVPGGRWLLAGCLGGYVRYCDLDSNNLEWKVLIEPSEAMEDFVQNVYKLETYADLNAPGLDFTLAVSTRDRRTTPIEWLHIWHVRPKDSDSLIANFLSSISTFRNRGSFYALAIGQHAVVRTRGLLRIYDKTAIEIYWWKRCSRSQSLRSHFLANTHTVAIYLIGDDRILCADRGAVHLYDIPEPELIDLTKNLEPRDEDIPSLEPIWSHSFPSSTTHYSPLYYNGTTYRFTACTEYYIWGFTIPAMKGNDPSVIKLSLTNSHRNPCVPGLYKAFALHNVVENGFRIGYHNVWESGDWRDATVYPEDILKGSPLITTDHPQSAFDEESGRFLYYHPGNEVVILDCLDTKY